MDPDQPLLKPSGKCAVLNPMNRTDMYYRCEDRGLPTSAANGKPYTVNRMRALEYMWDLSWPDELREKYTKFVTSLAGARLPDILKNFAPLRITDVSFRTKADVITHILQRLKDLYERGDPLPDADESLLEVSSSLTSETHKTDGQPINEPVKPVKERVNKPVCVFVDEPVNKHADDVESSDALDPQQASAVCDVIRSNPRAFRSISIEVLSADIQGLLEAHQAYIHFCMTQALTAAKGNRDAKVALQTVQQALDALLGKYTVEQTLQLLRDRDTRKGKGGVEVEDKEKV
ncbi:hypothetical protein F5Y18DRAFT_395756 [Xylariaceae sp. FL1019]|nr:hypothetical protein F5Y18DRAFT_395756 [Xylariaceae sp. FL1019]